MATQQWLRQLRDEPSRLQIDAAHPQPSVTVFCVPDLVRSMSPAYHQRKELQLGLLQRTMQTTGTQLLKVDIARSLHGKLHSIEGSWEAFAAAVVGDLQTARGHYQSDCSTGLADEVVLYLLALDALFLVVFFQFLNNKDFFLVEFQHLEPRLIDTAKTLIRSDLLLLENQIPMYLLKNVVAQLVAIRAAPTDTAEAIRILARNELDIALKVAVNHLYPLRHLDEQALTSCWTFNRRENKSETQRFYIHLDKKYPAKHSTKSLQSCKHILDCVYVVLCGHSLPVTAPQRSPSPCLDSIPSVSRLRAIGIDITDKAPALNQIKLTGCGYVTSATLSLPKVNIYDFTETVFHNLAVHEQLTGVHGLVEQRLGRRRAPDRPRGGGRQGGDRRGRHVEPHHEGRVHPEAVSLLAPVLPGHPPPSPQPREAMAERGVGALLLQAVDVSGLGRGVNDLVPHGGADVVHGGQCGEPKLALAEEKLKLGRRDASCESTGG